MAIDTFVHSIISGFCYVHTSHHRVRTLQVSNNFHHESRADTKRLLLLINVHSFAVLIVSNIRNGCLIMKNELLFRNLSTLSTVCMSFDADSRKTFSFKVWTLKLTSTSTRVLAIEWRLYCRVTKFECRKMFEVLIHVRRLIFSRSAKKMRKIN